MRIFLPFAHPPSVVKTAHSGPSWTAQRMSASIAQFIYSQQGLIQLAYRTKAKTAEKSQIQAVRPVQRLNQTHRVSAY